MFNTYGFILCQTKPAKITKTASRKKSTDLIPGLRYCAVPEKQN
jgi:hypothetical protein